MSEFPSTTSKDSHVGQDAVYYEAHQAELLEQYPEQWIAILNQKVVGLAPDPRELLLDLKSRDIPLRRVLVKHLTTKEEVWICLLYTSPSPRD